MKKLLLLTGCIFSILLSACGSSDDVDTGSLTMPRTSANEERSSYNANIIRDSAEHTDGFTYVTVRIRPQFVLHIDDNNNVVEFEALNSDADTLSAETIEAWQNAPFEDAFSYITEQCIIDGYISDNNPDIDISVDGDNASSIRTLTGNILKNATSTHGLTVEINLEGE